MQNTVTVPEWINGTVQQRQDWLESNTRWDDELLMGWAIAFRESGASISDSTIISMYHQRRNFFRQAA